MLSDLPYYIITPCFPMDTQTSILSGIASFLQFHLVKVIISVYCIFFGVLVCLVEGKNFIPKYDKLFPAKVIVVRFLPFLKDIWGRGALYILSGLVQCSQLHIINIFSGMFLIAVGILFVVVGIDTHCRLSKFRKSINNEVMLEQQFKLYSINNMWGVGALDHEQFAILIVSLTKKNIDGDELDAAFSYVDMDGDGLITLDDFRNWWRKADYDTEKGEIA